MKVVLKKGQLKSALIFVVLLMVFSFMAYAFERIQINYPSNEWVLSNSVPFNFTVNTTSASISYCALYVNNSGTMALKANYTDVTNATKHISGVAINDSHAFGVWGWNVTCSNGTSDFNTTTTTAFGVDGSIPSITLDSPANGIYLNNLNNTFFRYTPTDTSNPDTCEFYTNLSGTWKSNQTNRSWASGTQINVNLSLNAADHIAANIPDGKYAWGATCNDSATNGNSVFTQNRTFSVDTVVPTTPSFSIPANMNQTNATLRVEWSVVTEANFDRYDAVLSPYLNMSDPVQSKSNSGNTSNNFTTFTSVADGSYFIQIRAFDLVGTSANSTVRNYLLDTVVPNVTLNFPTANNSFLADSTPDFNVTVIDANPHGCSVRLSQLDGSALTLNVSALGVANGTKFNITIPTGETMADGVYQFNVECNDTANHRVNASSVPLQVTIDTVIPSAPYIISTFHQTNSTNKIPTLKWYPSVESNFSKYRVRASYFLNNSVAYEINITSKATNRTLLNLSANYTYTFNVTTFDRAGNQNSSGNTTIQTRYFVDPVCGVLNAGWNLCGAVWTSAKSLSLIANETGASQVAVFNSSHKFATCNAAVSSTGQHCNVNTNISSTLTNTTEDFSVNHAVFVYMNATGDWNNRTWEAIATSSNITLTNASGIGWNLEAGFVRNGRIFGDLAYNRFGTNISMMSLDYNNGSKVPYVNKGAFRGINNNTNFDYGRAMWMFFNFTNTTSGTHVLGNATFDVSVW